MKRATGKKAAEPERLPTHATGLVIAWDDKKDRPDPVTATEVEDRGREHFETFLREYEAWKRIEADQTEAEARRLYAEQVARHLVGVFPNARVSAEAYAAAIGEELGHRSADLLKLVAQRVRRTSKTLPPIATLIEMVESEADKRHRQAAVYAEALRAHADAIADGQRRAQAIAEQIAPYAPDIDANSIAKLWYELVLWPIGIPPDGGEQRAADLTQLFTLMRRGDAGAIEMARSALAETRKAEARQAAAEDQAAPWRIDGEIDAIFEDWRTTVAALVRGRSRS